MPVKLKVNTPEFRRRFEEAKARYVKEVRQAAVDTCAIWEGEIQERYRAGTGSATLARRSGRLAGSVRSNPRILPNGRAEPSTFIPQSGPLYTEIHEHGGTIRARNAPYMRFPVGPYVTATRRRGPWVSVRQVRIPARPVWATTARVTKAQVLRRWDRAVEALTRG